MELPIVDYTEETDLLAQCLVQTSSHIWVSANTIITGLLQARLQLGQYECLAA